MAIKGRVKVKDDEDLSRANILKVIELLEAEKPISKKEACILLRIAYNTTRLDKIITVFREKEADRLRRRADKRGTPASPAEIEHVITAYLEGTAITNISESLYRSTGFVKDIIKQYGVPTRRVSGKDYFKPELIPDEAVRTRFRMGEKVYSSRYDSVATVKFEVAPGAPSNKTTEYIYSIFLEDESELKTAYQPASELASLEHITNMGIKI